MTAPWDNVIGDEKPKEVAAMADSTDAIAALAALGLTRCEAEIYTGLLQLVHDGPVSGYGVAKALGRDAANTTKTLAALARRGAVQIAQAKPCLYLPTPPEQLTAELARRVYDRRDEAVRLLAELGPRAVAGGLYTLRDRDQVWHRCRQLVAAGRDLVLIEGSPECLAALQPELAAAGRRRVALLVHAARPCVIADARIFVDPAGEARLAAAPGPWLHLVVDGSARVDAFLHPHREQEVLQATWSDDPYLSYAAHRAIGDAIVHCAVAALKESGIDPIVISARTRELSDLIAQLVDWPLRWRQLGVPRYAPPVTAAAAPAVEARPETAYAPARVDSFDPRPETIGAVTPTTGEAVADSDRNADREQSTGLQFVFRRRPEAASDETDIPTSEDQSSDR